MSEPRMVGKIEIDEDLGFTRKEWHWQRIGWVIMGLLVLAGVLGAFGHGPIAEQRIGDPQVFAIEFDRIIRHSSTSDLTIHVGPGLQSDSVLHLAISRSYLKSQRVEAVWPEPLHQSARGEFIVFAFERDDPSFPLQIMLQVKSNSYGSASGKVHLVGIADLEINQFAMP